MKKVLIGLGVGCGVLILAGVAFMAVGGYLFKTRVVDKVSAIATSGGATPAQQKELASLDSKYPFDAPPKGAPLKLAEDRLQIYLAVRNDALPVYKSFEDQAKRFQSTHRQDAKGLDALEGAAEASTLLANLMTEMRASYAKSLDARKMSPREFGAITGAVYGSALEASMGSLRTQLTQQLAGVVAQEKAATPQQSAELEQQRAALNSAMASAPSPANSAIFQANAQLVDKYKAQFGESANAGFDVFVLGADSEFGKGVNMAMGLTPAAGAPAK